MKHHKYLAVTLSLLLMFTMLLTSCADGGIDVPVEAAPPEQTTVEGGQDGSRPPEEDGEEVTTQPDGAIDQESLDKISDYADAMIDQANKIANFIAGNGQNAPEVNDVFQGLMNGDGLDDIINGGGGQGGQDPGGNQGSDGDVTDASLQELVSRITIGELQDCDYDRDEWTSSSQRYECSQDHNGDGVVDGNDCEGTYRSIRNYGFYHTKWYDWNENSYLDPYNGEVTESVESAKGFDWDHVIPLAYVNSHGGADWTTEQKRAFADDPSVGVCVNAHDNRSKGAKGPSEWLPSVNQTDYCYTWLVIADEYGVMISEDDMATIRSILERCDVEELSVMTCTY